jgi:hypothetical protein
MPARSRTISISLRHDVDANLNSNLRFAELEHSIGLKGTYYIIVYSLPNTSVRDYENKALKSFVRNLKDLGHKVGLHSVAWSSDHPIAILQSELDIYSNLLEEPFSLNTKELLFTHHGFPSNRNVRLARLRLEYLICLNYRRFLYMPRKVILSDSKGILSCPYSCSSLRDYKPYEICLHPEYWF